MSELLVSINESAIQSFKSVDADPLGFESKVKRGTNKRSYCGECPNYRYRKAGNFCASGYDIDEMQNRVCDEYKPPLQPYASVDGY